MHTEVTIAETYLEKAILEHNAGRFTVEDAAMAKWWTTELQKRVVDRCLQLHGGYGYMLEYPVAKAFLDSPHPDHLRRDDRDHEGDRRSLARPLTTAYPTSDRTGMTAEAFIYDAVRTPRGKGKKTGALHSVKPISLTTGLIDEVRRRNPGLDPAQVDDIVLGVVSPVGEQGAVIARTAALAAGLPETVAGVQVNRFCASGLEAVNLAAQKVRSGFEDLVLAGGVESMSRVPMGSDGGAWPMDPETAAATRFVPQGIGADLIATLAGWSPGGRRRLRRRVARPRRQGLVERLLRPLRRPGARPQRHRRPGHRRAGPPGHDGRVAGRPALGVRRDRRHGRLRRGGAAEVPLGRADRPRAHRRQLQRHRRRRRAGRRRHRGGRHGATG